MGTIVTCDRCSKKITPKEIDNKFGMTMSGNIAECLAVLDDKQPNKQIFSYRSFEFCPKCAKVLLPKIIKILKKK